MVGNISKWGCGTILVLIAFVVAVGIAGAILLPEPDEGQSTKEPQKEEVLNPKEEPVRKPVPTTSTPTSTLPRWTGCPSAERNGYPPTKPYSLIRPPTR